MIQGKRDSKGIFTTEGELSSKGMTILQHLWSNNASTNCSTQTKDLPHNPLRVHEPLAIEFRPTGKVARCVRVASGPIPTVFDSVGSKALKTETQERVMINRRMFSAD